MKVHVHIGLRGLILTEVIGGPLMGLLMHSMSSRSDKGIHMSPISLECLNMCVKWLSGGLWAVMDEVSHVILLDE